MKIIGFLSEIQICLPVLFGHSPVHLMALCLPCATYWSFEVQVWESFVHLPKEWGGQWAGVPFQLTQPGLLAGQAKDRFWQGADKSKNHGLQCHSWLCHKGPVLGPDFITLTLGQCLYNSLELQFILFTSLKRKH